MMVYTDFSFCFKFSSILELPSISLEEFENSISLSPNIPYYKYISNVHVALLKIIFEIETDEPELKLLNSLTWTESLIKVIISQMHYYFLKSMLIYFQSLI